MVVIEKVETEKVDEEEVIIVGVIGMAIALITVVETVEIIVADKVTINNNNNKPNNNKNDFLPKSMETVYVL